MIFTQARSTGQPWLMTSGTAATPGRKVLTVGICESTAPSTPVAINETGMTAAIDQTFHALASGSTPLRVLGTRLSSGAEQGEQGRH